MRTSHSGCGGEGVLWGVLAKNCKDEKKQIDAGLKGIEKR